MGAQQQKTWYRFEVARANPDVAEIYLHDEIGMFGVTSGEFVRDLRNLTQPVIKLHVNSPGGSVDDGIAIFNALRTMRATVEVYVDALAASIASVIAMAAAPGKLVMAPHSRMMIHEAMAMGFGFAADFEKTAARLRDTTRNIASIYVERAGKDVDHWLGLMAEETWFTDEQAVTAGLADAVGRDHEESNFLIAADFALLSQYKHGGEVARALRPAVPADAEAAAGEPGEENAGRTMSSANLAKLHDAMSGMDGIHKSVCDMGDECPRGGAANVLPVAEAAIGEQAVVPEGDPVASPELELALKRHELERRLAMVRL